MKKRLLLVLTVAFALCFSGCTVKETTSSSEIVDREETDENYLEEKKENEEEEKQDQIEEQQENTYIGNPYIETTKEEMQKETGLVIDAPYGVEDGKYFIVNDGENKSAQVIFNVGEHELTYRAEFTDLAEGYDTTGLFYTWDEEKEVEVGHCKATIMICDEAKGIYWLDAEPGINYSLSCVSDIDEGQFTGLANLCYASTNGDEEDDIPFASVDYEGEYENENGDTVSMVRNENGMYTISISIVKLCQLDGEANDVDSGAEFLVKDPNGNDMTGVFHTNEDETYSFIITGSEWEYINNQDEYIGFIRK